MRLGATDFARNDNKASRENRENFVQKCKAPANFGFTIIEVALVLAIAGLIFLVVFLTLPALQKSQRDTARRQDVAKAVAAIQQFYADGGDATTIPTNTSHPTRDAGDLFADVPVLGPYLSSAGISSNVTKLKIFPYPACPIGATAWGGVGTVEVFVGCTYSGKADGGNCNLSAASAYHVVVATQLESGSSNRTDGANDYCADASR